MYHQLHHRYSFDTEKKSARGVMKKKRCCGVVVLGVDLDTLDARCVTQIIHTYTFMPAESPPTHTQREPSPLIAFLYTMAMRNFLYISFRPSCRVVLVCCSLRTSMSHNETIHAFFTTA